MIATARGEKTVSSTMSKTLNTYQIVFRHPTLGVHECTTETPYSMREMTKSVDDFIAGKEPIGGIGSGNGEAFQVRFTSKIAAEGIFEITFLFSREVDDSLEVARMEAAKEAMNKYASEQMGKSEGPF